MLLYLLFASGIFWVIIATIYEHLGMNNIYNLLSSSIVTGKLCDKIQTVSYYYTVQSVNDTFLKTDLNCLCKFIQIFWIMLIII